MKKGTLRRLLLLSSCLWPAMVRGQIFVSTGPSSGLRMFAPNAADWWLQPFNNQLEVIANGQTGSPLLTISSSGLVGVSVGVSSARLEVASPVNETGPIWKAIQADYGNATGVIQGLISLGANGTTNAGFGLNMIDAADADLTIATRNGGSLLEKVRITSAGNVGIGTTSPSYSRLQIASDLTYNELGQLEIQGATNPNNGLALGYDTSTGFGYIYSRNYTVTPTEFRLIGRPVTFRGQLSGSEFMRIDTTGNVGISSASPQGLFAVGNGTMVVTSAGNVGIGTAGPSSALHVLRDVGTTYGNAQLTLDNGTTTTNEKLAILFSGHQVANALISFNTSATASGRHLSLSAGNAESDFIIDGAGNVGVGTATPQSILHLSSGAPSIVLQASSPGSLGQTNIDSWDAGNGYLMSRINSAQGSAVGRGDLSFLLRNDAGSLNTVMIMDGQYGYVGVGTTTVPGELLDVEGGNIKTSGVIKIDPGAGGNPQIRLQQGGTAKGYVTYYNSTGDINIQQSGNGTGGINVNSSDSVGIGTTIPLSKLDVNGTIRQNGLSVNNQGTYSNLASKNTSASLLAVTADSLALYDGTNTQEVRSVSLTVNTAASGANGLDTGSLAASTWYYLYVINNGAATAGLLSASATAPTLPGGYTYKRLVGAVVTDSLSHLVNYQQYGPDVYFDAAAFVIFTAQTGATSLTSVSIAAAVPSTAVLARGTMGTSVNAQRMIGVAADASGLGLATGEPPVANGLVNGFYCRTHYEVPVTTAQTLYWEATDANAYYRLTVEGFRINL